MKKQYIKSVIELLKAGEKPETIFNNLKKTLEARGHSSLHRHILLGALRELSAEGRVSVPVVALAANADKSKFSAAIKNALERLDADIKNAKFIEDASLTGGFIATYNHQTIDASYKSKLLNWYRSAVASK